MYIPEAAEEAAIGERVLAKLSLVQMSRSKCDACPRVLEDADQKIRGYASGVELGLCRACASWVNTPSAIAYAEQLGVEIKAPIVPPVTIKREPKHE